MAGVHFCAMRRRPPLEMQFGTYTVRNCITGGHHGALMQLCTTSPTQRR